MSTLSDLRRFILRHDLIPPGSRVVVGVSGGPDSLGLLHALMTLAPEFDWHLHAAYLHHGLRPEADEEARFVAEVAGAWGLGCTVERAPVREVAAQPGVSLEEAARQLRYAFLGRVALRLGATVVAVGHHADDQVETVLMHLLRGSGLAGLRGMLPSTPLSELRLTALPPDMRPDVPGIRLVRPWLETPRQAILAYCRAVGLQPRVDATNTDETFFRNRLRHQVVPLLRQINPRLTRVLGHTAAALQGDYEVLAAHRQGLWTALATVGEEWVRFDLTGFRGLLRGDQRGLVRKAIALLRPELRDIGWEHVERLLDVLAADPARCSGGPYPLVAGLAARLDYTHLVIGPETMPARGHPAIVAPHHLTPPGRLALGPDWELVVTAVAWSPEESPPWHGVNDPHRVWLPADVPLPLIVRPRQPGDRLRVFGLDGSKSLTDLMNELKLPRAARATWPLLCAADGEILWVVGQRAGERCRVAPTAGRAWEVRLLPRTVITELSTDPRRSSFESIPED